MNVFSNTYQAIDFNLWGEGGGERERERERERPVEFTRPKYIRQLHA